MQRTQTPEDKIISNILNETKQSESDSLALLLDAKKIGNETNNALDAQGKQIGVVQDGVDEVLYRQELATHQIRSISSIFWDFWYVLFPRVKWVAHHRDAAHQADMLSTTAKINKKLGRDVVGDALKGTSNAQSYKETEDKLDQMSRTVSDLNDIAKEMGTKINDHNQQLDVLNDTAKQAGNKMDVLQTKTRRLIG